MCFSFIINRFFSFFYSFLFHFFMGLNCLFCLTWHLTSRMVFRPHLLFVVVVVVVVVVFVVYNANSFNNLMIFVNTSDFCCCFIHLPHSIESRVKKKKLPYGKKTTTCGLRFCFFLFSVSVYLFRIVVFYLKFFVL